ncbi:MAG: carboxypeptidase-like regulatory domain-containing protein [Bryobacteraceae bacterium]
MRLFVASLFVCSLFAQSDSARLAGVVTDPTGAAVPRAKIKVRNERTGFATEATAGDDGAYLFRGLKPGTYEITGEADGLGPTSYKEIGLVVGQERQFTIVIQPAALTQEVTVAVPNLATVDTSSASVGANINEREVANMPLSLCARSAPTPHGAGCANVGNAALRQHPFRQCAQPAERHPFRRRRDSSIVDASPGNLNGETSTGLRAR